MKHGSIFFSVVTTLIQAFEYRNCISFVFYNTVRNLAIWGVKSLLGRAMAEWKDWPSRPHKWLPKSRITEDR